MSPKKRFDYLQSSSGSANQDDIDSSLQSVDLVESATRINKESEVAIVADRGEASLSSVPRGEGRMEQDREQLNVRIPKLLKRKAMAKAVLEGITIGDVIEEMLLKYVSEAG